MKTIIKGDKLIELGFKPSKWFKTALTYINSNNITNSKEMIAYCNTLNKPLIKYHNKPMSYSLNIHPTNEDEKNNIDNVIKTMDTLMRLPVVLQGAVMPDACPAGNVGTIPVGGVVAVKNAIVPNFHSADICCSLMTSIIPTVDHKIIMDISQEVTHFGFGSNPLFVDKLPSGLIEKIEGNFFTKDLLIAAQKSIGTQGDGNHFLSIGKINDSDMAITTHHGSRSFGAKLFKKGKNIAEKLTYELTGLKNNQNAWIPFDTKEGQDYWEALQIIEEWTMLNHAVIHNEISKRLSINIAYRIWNPHNFVFKKEDIFYHAKGATPISNKIEFRSPDIYGQRIIPMNMNEPILIVQDSGVINGGLGFAPHGAGRNVSRTEHIKRNISDIEIETKDIDVRFYSGVPDISELPSAYKSASEVEKQIKHYNLAKIVCKIHPIGCIMAGKIEQYWIN